MTKPNENEKSGPSPAASKDAEKTINLWSALIKGSKCLARSTEPDEDGYYLAVVQDVSPDGATLTLKWASYPKLPTFKAKRLAVGLIQGSK